MGDLVKSLALFAEHEVGGFRKITASGSAYFMRLGERTEQAYRGKSPGTRYMVVATLVDIHGAPIDDKTYFVPDGFLRSNVHLLPTVIPGKTVKERVGSVLSAGAGAAEVVAEVVNEVMSDTPAIPLMGDDFNSTTFGPVKPPPTQPRNYVPTFGKQAPDNDSPTYEDEIQNALDLIDNRNRRNDANVSDERDSDEETLDDKRKRAAQTKRRCVMCCPIVLRTCTHTCHCAGLKT